MDFRKFISLLVILVVILALVSAKTCPIKYQKLTPEHSFCKNPNPKCKVIKQGVIEADFDVIVREHNQLRFRVAEGQQAGAGGTFPKASNMMKLEWDVELASIAQSWALQCISNHDCQDCRRVDRFDVGQTYASSSSIHLEDSILTDWKYPIDRWYNEKDSVTQSQIRSFQPIPNTGNFTQLIWAETSKVGCGFVLHKDGDLFKSIYICNYGPGGNVIGSSVYKEGEPCSKCPSGTSCSESYYGLCESDVTNIEKEDNEDKSEGSNEDEDLSHAF